MNKVVVLGRETVEYRAELLLTDEELAQFKEDIVNNGWVDACGARIDKSTDMDGYPTSEEWDWEVLVNGDTLTGEDLPNDR